MGPDSAACAILSGVDRWWRGGHDGQVLRLTDALHAEVSGRIRLDGKVLTCGLLCFSKRDSDSIRVVKTVAVIAGNVQRLGEMHTIIDKSQLGDVPATK